ncbi:ankyrin repeat domain-containing protein [Winogradskyella jejuensis]|uniref:Ankyrin repeat-containing protein n=1 Tax=Winogradskyella jejuensis TaxID=1089305 RepID=A0A1M5L472_9FLAO|nr:ankyrin repeat domain-containing protein [Winogradskyella jejuensis]SHG59904.1 Ankyrin repeat-containing protein [Winogradskyella jejuensis]
MKKSVTVLALALCLSLPTVNASNFENLPESLTIVENTIEVSALCTAAAKGDVEKVKQLLQNGVDVNVKSNGMLPIHYAARFNRVDVIKVLITSGSEIHTTCDKGLTALRHAEKTNAKEAAQFLKRFKK